MPRLQVTIAAGMLLCACTIGKDYVRPVVDTPDQWRVEIPQQQEFANSAWWQQFNDPVLNQLIDEALRENRDLRIAAARVDQFIGALTTTRSQYFPQIGYGGSVSRNRATEHGTTPLPPGVDPWYNIYEASLGASWQIDLFGRVRRQSEAVQAQVFASEQGRRGVVLSLVTSVASSYIELRALDRQLEISHITAGNYEKTLKLFELRFKAGMVSQMAVEQIRSQYQQALTIIPTIERQISAQENLISILLGRNPGPIERGRPLGALEMPVIPADLPSTLLERRPDILQAEQNLIAANAQVGVAKSLYYPTISITGLLGTASVALGNFLSAASTVAQIAAGVSGPIFTAGAIEGQVQSAEAAERVAVDFYRQTILNAFRETNDALVASAKTREETGAQVKRVASLREYARLAWLTFEKGYSNYIDVLFAENELFNAELAAVSSQADSYTQLVNVYKAVGGGWIDVAEDHTPKPELTSSKEDNIKNTDSN